MGADGADPRRLTDEPEPVGWPAWSDDGARLWFYRRVDGRYRVLELDLATSAVRRPFELPGDAFRPLPSPGGAWLLLDLVSERTGDHDLHRLELATGALQRLTRHPGYDSDARWSPDGSTIAFHSDRDAERFHTQVYVMPGEGGTPRQITDGPATNGYPAWSPDGRCVVHTTEAGDDRDLAVVAVDGAAGSASDGARWRLTERPGFDGDPLWRPGGGYVLFSTDRFGGQELALLELPSAVRRRCEEAAG